MIASKQLPFDIRIPAEFNRGALGVGSRDNSDAILLMLDGLSFLQDLHIVLLDRRLTTR